MAARKRAPAGTPQGGQFVEEPSSRAVRPSEKRSLRAAATASVAAEAPPVDGFVPPATSSCNVRSDAYVRWLARRGIRAEKLSFTDTPGGKAPHAAALVEGVTVVDWTYRQFDRDAPEPLVEPLDEYLGRWDDYGTDFYGGMILNSWKSRRTNSG